MKKSQIIIILILILVPPIISKVVFHKKDKKQAIKTLVVTKDTVTGFCYYPVNTVIDGSEITYYTGTDCDSIKLNN